jgi:hypothetical protein
MVSSSLRWLSSALSSMQRREVAFPSNIVGPGKSNAVTTSLPLKPTPFLTHKKSIGPAHYPLSIIINSFIPNQQGHSMLQLQLSIIFPFKFHVMVLQLGAR